MTLSQPIGRNDSSRAAQKTSRRLQILVYQIGSLGDTLITLPALRAVRNHFGPASDIVMLHNSAPEELVSPESVLKGNGFVDRFISYTVANETVRKFRSVVHLWRTLRRTKFTAVVYLAPAERAWASVHRDYLFFSSCGIPNLIGFHSYSKKVLYPKSSDGQLERVASEASCRLERLQRDGVHIDNNWSDTRLSVPPSEKDVCRKFLEANRRYPERLLVAICPGAKQSANIWPIDRFSELGLRLVSQGRIEPIVIGGPKEQELGRRLVDTWGAGINAAGQFSILGSAALISFCTFCIGLDTGTTHLAAAVGVPCVAIFGAREHPGRWDPLGTENIVVRSAPVACAGCRFQDCPIEGHPCMTNITVRQVWDAVQRMESRLVPRVSVH